MFFVKLVHMGVYPQASGAEMHGRISGNGRGAWKGDQQRVQQVRRDWDKKGRHVFLPCVRIQ